MVGSVSTWGSPVIYPVSAYGSASVKQSNRAIIKAEKDLAKAQAECVKWTEEVRRRSRLRGLKRLTFPVGPAEKRRDKWCAKAAALELALQRLREDAAQLPEAQLVASGGVPSVSVPDGSTSPLAALGIGGAILAVVGVLAYLFWR